MKRILLTGINLVFGLPLELSLPEGVLTFQTTTLPTIKSSSPYKTSNYNYTIPHGYGNLPLSERKRYKVPGSPQTKNKMFFEKPHYSEEEKESEEGFSAEEYVSELTSRLFCASDERASLGHRDSRDFWDRPSLVLGILVPESYYREP